MQLVLIFPISLVAFWWLLLRQSARRRQRLADRQQMIITALKWDRRGERE